MVCAIATAAGHQVVDDEHPLAVFVDALNGPRLAVVGGLHINQRRCGNQRKRRRQVKAAKGNAGDEVVGRQVRMPHGLQGLHFRQHQLGGVPQRLGVADQPAQVDVHRRVDHGFPEGKIAKLYAAESPQFLGQPQVGDPLVS